MKITIKIEKNIYRHRNDLFFGLMKMCGEILKSILIPVFDYILMPAFIAYLSVCIWFGQDAILNMNIKDAHIQNIIFAWVTLVFFNILWHSRGK